MEIINVTRVIEIYFDFNVACHILRRLASTSRSVIQRLSGYHSSVAKREEFSIISRWQKHQREVRIQQDFLSPFGFSLIARAREKGNSARSLNNCRQRWVEGTREGEIAGETSRLLLPRSQECCSRCSIEMVERNSESAAVS